MMYSKIFEKHATFIKTIFTQIVAVAGNLHLAFGLKERTNEPLEVDILEFGTEIWGKHTYRLFMK
jgi:hypothetical protein